MGGLQVRIVWGLLESTPRVLNLRKAWLCETGISVFYPTQDGYVLTVLLTHTYMIPTYRRFDELRAKAKKKLEGRGILEKQLTNAVIEISYMRENEVPEYAWDSVESILSRCRTHEPQGDEGRFRASINAMTYEQLDSLKRAIELL
jgi:hypothetical protein